MSDVCIPCPKDQYQDESGQDQCKPCPEDLHTGSPASTNLTQCKDFRTESPEPEKTAEVEMKYALVVVCTSRIADTVRTTLRARVLDLRSEWPAMCPDSTCPNAHVTAECEGTHSKVVITVVKLEELPATLTDLSTGTTMTAESMLQKSATHGDAFEMPETGAVLQKDDVHVTIQETCPEGLQKFEDTCDCGEGTFKDFTDGDVQCHVCPLGTYQHEPRKVSCNQCPAGTSTTFTGANERSDCTGSSSGVSVTLIGSVVGGLVGFLAVVVVVGVFCRLFREGGPMHTIFITKRERQSDEHSYSGLAPTNPVYDLTAAENLEMKAPEKRAQLDRPKLPARLKTEDETAYHFIEDGEADNDSAGMDSSYSRLSISQTPANGTKDGDSEDYSGLVTPAIEDTATKGSSTLQVSHVVSTADVQHDADNENQGRNRDKTRVSKNVVSSFNGSDVRDDKDDYLTPVTGDIDQSDVRDDKDDYLTLIADDIDKNFAHTSNDVNDNDSITVAVDTNDDYMTGVENDNTHDYLSPPDNDANDDNLVRQTDDRDNDDLTPEEDYVVTAL